MERLTHRTVAGGVAVKISPKRMTKRQKRAALMEKYQQCAERLADFEDAEESGRWIMTADFEKMWEERGAKSAQLPFVQLYNGWFKASRDKPTEGEPVLLYWRNKAQNKAHYTITHMENGQYVTLSTEKYPWIEPIAWMELPQPPRSAVPVAEVICGVSFKDSLEALKRMKCGEWNCGEMPMAEKEDSNE